MDPENDRVARAGAPPDDGAALAPPAADAPATWDPADLADLLARLDGHRAAMLALERKVLEGRPDLLPARRASARNFAHYLALRRQDVRDTQARLRRLGLSSLGRIEGQVLANLDAVRRVLHGLLGRPWAAPPAEECPVPMEGSAAVIEARAAALFGPCPSRRRVRVMVTLPSEAATDAGLVRDLVRGGMDVARVNCAHDGEAAWERTIRNVRAAAEAQGRTCRVLMDLAGPKLRTGAVEPGPAVLRWAPERDERGGLVRPARVLLSGLPAEEAPGVAHDAVLRAPADWVAARGRGDEVSFRDLRGRGRRMSVVATGPEGALCEADEAALVEPGTVLTARRVGRPGPPSDAVVLHVPPTEGRILLRPGDEIVLTREATPGRPALRDAAGRATEPARVPCTLPEVFAQVQAGESVWFDDGRIGGRVRSVDADRILVEVVQASREGSRLGPDKGINLPDTRFATSGLTAADRANLPFVVRHADLVGLSFANGARDVRDLWRALREAGDRVPGVLVKIETRRGFEHLPEILLAAMECPAVGVMIARGDLAVECGFARLAEVQEEVLWMCEAAHVPTVWATQVLETLAKKGRPTRAEVTDAAMSVRAECVMLNKGPHVLDALGALDDILRRMEAHQSKKQSLLRSLRVSRMD